MIPIRDTTPSRNVPVINNTLIGINVVVFVLEVLQGPAGDRFIYTYGLVPARYTIDHIANHFSQFHQIFAWLSFMFLHGGIWHLLSNMWFLHIFGDNVEDRLGPARYLLFYLSCGLVSGLSHFVLNLHSTAPVIGASGAVAGVMGGYFLLHPKSKILTLVPIIIIPFFFEIPAFFFLGLWFFLQFINAAASSGAAGGVAWWAHIGGFVFGMIFLKLFDALPAAGLTARLRQATLRKKTQRLQVARPTAMGDDPDLYAVVTVSPYEALVGSRKLVTVPHGLQRRVFNVIVPPGITPGKLLRLRGQGKTHADGSRGDLLLKIVIQ
jgi:membrane associated rhomboid family serine protease